MDTPVGSVMVGGDAGNDVTKPSRDNSTSAAVENLARGADILVHSTIHPLMVPGKGSGFPSSVFFHQNTTSDLGAMSKRAGISHLMLTHLVPPMGAPRHGRFKVPGGALKEGDYTDAAKSGGFPGNVIVGQDLSSLRLPQK